MPYREDVPRGLGLDDDLHCVPFSESKSILLVLS